MVQAVVRRVVLRLDLPPSFATPPALVGVCRQDRQKGVPPERKVLGCVWTIARGCAMDEMRNLAVENGLGRTAAA
jgi:hypothetical protein